MLVYNCVTLITQLKKEKAQQKHLCEFSSGKGGGEKKKKKKEAIKKRISRVCHVNRLRKKKIISESVGIKEGGGFCF